ncbi:hypothetical protein VIGAN_09072000, partial [Vigna angularis var. angularis]
DLICGIRYPLQISPSRSPKFDLQVLQNAYPQRPISKYPNQTLTITILISLPRSQLNPKLSLPRYASKKPRCTPHS